MTASLEMKCSTVDTNEVPILYMGVAISFLIRESAVVDKNIPFEKRVRIG
jgi:hypothetical protein